MQEERTNVPKIRFKGFTKDWEQRKLGDFIDVKSGKDYKHLNSGSIPVYGTGGYMLSVDRALSDIDAIGIGRKGTIDKPYLLKAPFWTVDTLFYAVPKQNIDLQFSLSIFKKINWKKFDESTGVPSLSKTVINSVGASVPSYEEQKKIGSFFKQLDETIALHQRGLDLLKQTKKSYLQKMFPKKGEDKPEIRFAGFTDAWEQRKLGEMVKQFSIKSKKEDEYTVLSSTNSGMEIRDGRVSGTSNLGYKIVEDGDLVLSPQNLWLGNININDIGKGLVSPSYKTFKFTNINSAFLKPQLHTSKMLEEYKNSSTQGASIVRRNLELDSFYQIPMLVPTTEEQSKLGVFFESMDNTITLHQRELDSLKEMKKSLLQQMFV